MFVFILTLGVVDSLEALEAAVAAASPLPSAAEPAPRPDVPSQVLRTSGQRFDCANRQPPVGLIAAQAALRASLILS